MADITQMDQLNQFLEENEISYSKNTLTEGQLFGNILNDDIPHHIIAIAEEPVKIGLLRTDEFKFAVNKMSL